MSQFDKQITLLDASFAAYGDPVSAFESLAYSDAWDKHGSMSLVVGADEFANVNGAAWLTVDGRVYECETIDSDDNDRTVTVSGSSLNVLFDRIVITEKERLQGRLEERVRYLVNKYALTGVQAVSGLVLGADNNYKRAMDATTTRGQTLSEFLYTAMNQRGFSFLITLVAGVLTFNVLQGLDRTASQNVNAPVQLSTRVEIEKATYKKSTKDFRNFAVVCDEDETSPQTVYVDQSNGAAKRSMYVSGRSAGADDSAATSMFVMVGQYSSGVGYIATSTDGQTWTDRVTSGYGAFWAVDYHNGRFVVGGSTGDVLTSIDGVSWTKYESGTTSTVEGIGYIDGAYFLFNNTGAVGSSYDGQSFFPTYISNIHRKCVNAVLADGKLIAFSSGISDVEKLVSIDGFEWTGSLIDAPGSPIITVPLRTVYDRGILCSSGYWYDGSTYKPMTITSTDSGQTQTMNIIESLSGKRFLDMAAGNGVFVAVGQSNLIAWSYDGVVWTDAHPSGGTPDYIAVTFDGSTFHAYSATTKHHAYSTDGKTWTLTTFSTSAQLIDAVTYGTSSHVGNLYQMGIDALNEAVVVEALDGDVNSDLAPVYETDYNYGDVIDAIDPDRGIVAQKRVYSVDHVIDKNNDFAIIPKLGKDFLSLRKFIAKEIRNNGV